MAERRICAIDGCEKPFHAHGYCSRHAYHYRTHGDPLGGRRGASPGEPLRWIAEQANFSGDECLTWPFEIGSNGYGIVKVDGVKRIASRVMCETKHGPPPTGHHEAAHACGNGHQACMNSRHLSWKTRKENIGDAIEHGTWNHGETVPQHKLTADEVLEIRRLGKTTRQQELANRFGVGQGTISKILSGARWGWLT